MKKVYSILGDFYHKHDLILRSLKEATLGLKDEVEIIDVSIDKIHSVIEAKPDLIIMNCENRVNPQDPVVYNWMTAEVEKALVSYVSEGGSLLVWHAGLASYDEKGEYVDMLKGYFLSHPVENKPVRYFTSQSSTVKDITMNFEVLLDEHYFVACDEKNTNVFLWSESEDGNSIAAWRHEFNKGKVCCITPSHREEGLLHSDMLKLLSYCIDWCF
jgi:type 1 glutamine amidotransferase